MENKVDEREMSRVLEEALGRTYSGEYDRVASLKFDFGKDPKQTIERLVDFATDMVVKQGGSPMTRIVKESHNSYLLQVPLVFNKDKNRKLKGHLLAHMVPDLLGWDMSEDEIAEMAYGTKEEDEARAKMKQMLDRIDGVMKKSLPTKLGEARFSIYSRSKEGELEVNIAYCLKDFSKSWVLVSAVYNEYLSGVMDLYWLKDLVTKEMVLRDEWYASWRELFL